MIQSFKDPETEKLFRTGVSKRHHSIVRIALRKLIQMNHAQVLSDLAVPPGNRLEILQGSLRGRYSIRINDQWRILFEWTNEGPKSVTIVDYH